MLTVALVLSALTIIYLSHSSRYDKRMFWPPPSIIQDHCVETNFRLCGTASGFS